MGVKGLVFSSKRQFWMLFWNQQNNFKINQIYRYKGCAIKVDVKFNLYNFHLIKSFSNEIWWQYRSIIKYCVSGADDAMTYP